MTSPHLEKAFEDGIEATLLASRPSFLRASTAGARQGRRATKSQQEHFRAASDDLTKFARHFYQYKPLRPLAEIEAEIRKLEAEIQGMVGEAL